MKKGIMIVGVGGQGSLLAAKIIGRAAVIQGYDVKVSEVHGMSQRGGSVVTYVKYGDKVYSPIICRGEADVILSFELLEAARWLPYLKKGGVIVTSEQRINPMSVITGKAVYPEAIAEELEKAGATVVSADSLDLARKAGNEKASNVALIGLGEKYFGIDSKILRDAVSTSVPEKFVELNLRAFDLGSEASGTDKKNKE